MTLKELCVKKDANITEVKVMNFVDSYNPSAKYILALLCVPGVCNDGSYKDNNTSRDVLNPGLKSDDYIVL